MALLGHHTSFPIRSSNKAAEWSNLCNDVFQQYLDDDDPFGLTAELPERCISGSSGNHFDFSGSSKQSNGTSVTSPAPSLELPVQAAVLEAKQPKAKEPLGFWARTLCILEKNAARSEQRLKPRSAKSNPDFLSLGGYPSPPPLSRPVDQPFLLQRQRPRIAANGTKPANHNAVDARSPSRGRSMGLAKPSVATIVNPYATIRKPRKSPSKMMSPSRYRAGLKDGWEIHTESSPPKHGTSIPFRPVPMSTPSSAEILQDNFAAFGCQPHHSVFGVNGNHVSPLTNSFHNAQINTPDTSPLLSPDSGNYAYLGPPPVLANDQYGTLHQPPPANKPNLIPSYLPKNTPSVSDNKFDDFDFEFPANPTVNPWGTMPPDIVNSLQSSEYSSASSMEADPFIERVPVVLPTTETYDIGLGISCNPRLVSKQPELLDTAPISPFSTLPIYSSEFPRPPTVRRDLGGLPFVSPPLLSNQPLTPTHTRHPSDSPPALPPSPLAEPRPTRRRGSSTTPRRVSRHRRTKSTSSTPRVNGESHAGFVNFTPQDSGKILNGVAPSGSSKTKARREKEAADKRRRLSQAAVKAVVDAGGDLEALRKAGLVLG